MRPLAFAIVRLAFVIESCRAYVTLDALEIPVSAFVDYLL